MMKWTPDRGQPQNLKQEDQEQESRGSDSKIGDDKNSIYVPN
jgi:hypothetical protein